MPISSTANQVSVVLTSATQAIAFSPVFYDSTDLIVSLIVSGDTSSSTMSEATHYTVSGGSGAGGTVTLTGTGVTIGDTVIIRREIPYTQDLDLEENDPLPANALEQRLDRLTIQLLQLKASLEFAVRLSETSNSGNTIAATELVDITSKILGFNASDALVGYSGSDIQALLNLPETVVDQPTKTFSDAAARAAAVPDFTGQVGYQLDTKEIYGATGVTAGDWTLGKGQLDIADLDAHSGIATTTKLAVDESGVDKRATVADLLALSEPLDYIGIQVFT